MPTQPEPKRPVPSRAVLWPIYAYMYAFFGGGTLAGAALAVKGVVTRQPLLIGLGLAGVGTCGYIVVATVRSHIRTSRRRRAQ